MLNYAMMALCLSDFETAEFAVREAVELGMNGIDWTGAAFAKDPPEYLKKISSDAGLKVVCYIPFLNKLSNGESGGVDEMMRELDRASGVGADKILIPTMPLGRKGLSRTEIQSVWLDVLGKAADECAKRNITPMVENFPGEFSPVVTADDFLFFHKHIPSLRLTFDEGNAFTGEDPAESYTETAEYTLHIHFKDYTVRTAPADGYWRGLDGRFYRSALIGEGDCPHGKVLKAVIESGYSGWIDVEYESNDIPRAEGIARAARNLMEMERGICCKEGKMQ